MKKTLLLLIIAALSTFIMVSCKEDVMLANPSGTGNNGNTNNPGGNNGSNGNTTNTTGCFISEMGEGDEKTTFNYSDKNILLSEESNDGKSTFEYDASNRISKIIHKGSGTETFTYEYDSKGNISKVRYNTEGSGFFFSVSELIYITNAKGQVEKIQTVEDGITFDYLIEYDTKNNIKKIIGSAMDFKETLLENTSFDDKPNLYTHTNLAKAYLAHAVLAATFGGNATRYCNTNNVLLDKTLNLFEDGMVSTTYTYQYNEKGMPSKVNWNSNSESGEQTIKYNCK